MGSETIADENSERGVLFGLWSAAREELLC